MELKDKIAVITGAASGIGWEVARLAARSGMKLMLVDIRAAELALAAATLANEGAEVDTRCMDVSKEAELSALAEQTVQRFGVPHVLFNNAGIGLGGLLWEHTAKDWQWAIDVNLMSIAHAIRIFVPLMLEAASADAAYEACIVNTASMAGLVVTPNLGAYTVTKHAVVALSEQLYHDLSLVTSQVHCAVLCPYFVPTGIYDSTRYRPQDLDDGAPLTPSKQMAQVAGEKAVKGGVVSAEEIAAKVIAALRDGSYYIYSHPKAMRPVRKRMEEILEGRNPGDPFAMKPAIRVAMRQALLGEAAATPASAPTTPSAD